jgi:hypothetical protein
MSAEWSTSIHGDPRTPDVGYFDQVSGGQMAGLKPTDDATMAQLTENLKAFLCVVPRPTPRARGLIFA